MMDIQHVISLIDAVSNANIMNFQIEEGSFKLSMDKLTQRTEVSPATSVSTATGIASDNKQLDTDVQKSIVVETKNSETQKVSLEKVESSAVTKVADAANIKVVESPIVGTFYSAAGPDSDNFVKIGDKVKTGQVLCIVEAMKLMNDIESDYEGEIVEILVKNEQMVEYGQPLFKIKVS